MLYSFCRSLELYKQFPEEPSCISLHPNSLSILVGFSDKVCLMNLLTDEFRTIQKFDVDHCSKVCIHSPVSIIVLKHSLWKRMTLRQSVGIEMR